jgi:GGDEF domain-containing protein
MLIEVAGRLTTSVRDDDTVARVGPAHFGLLVDVGGAENVDGLARRIAALVRRPIAYHDTVICLTGHVGLAVSTHGADPDDVLLLAEGAMAVASQPGGNGYFCVPEPSGSPSDDRGTSEEGSEGTAHR